MHKQFDGVSELAKAGKHRMVDAQMLLNAARWRGAMYMAGYSIECLLKTKLMQTFGCHHLRELEDELLRRGKLSASTTIYTHQLELLLRLTGGLDRLRENEEHWRRFNMVNQWLPAWRYHHNPSKRDDAEDFMAAVASLLQWIENNI